MKDSETVISQIKSDSYRTPDGLTEEMFLFSSTLVPLVNVDLLIVDKNNRVLLSWRDDIHCGTGWHIPGGIIRHGESIETRIQKTAINETGFEVMHTEQPIIVAEHHLIQEERNHFVSLLYKCKLDDSFDIKRININKSATTPGYLKWFDKYPGEGKSNEYNGLVYSQYAYFEFLKEWFKNEFTKQGELK